MENLNAFIFRIAVAALVSAVFCAGAVFFVVDISLRGVETAIHTTNTRFDDVNARFDDVNARFDDMNARFDDVNARFDSVDRSIDALRSEITDGFRRIESAMREEQDRRGALERDSAAQGEEIELAIGAMLMMLPLLEKIETDDPDATARLAELRGRMALICERVLGSSHPGCTRQP